MESGKLIVGNEEYEVFVCDDCGEHEAQVKVLDGMVCYECWCVRRGLDIDEDITYLADDYICDDFEIDDEVSD